MTERKTSTFDFSCYPYQPKDEPVETRQVSKKTPVRKSSRKKRRNSTVDAQLLEKLNSQLRTPGWMQQELVDNKIKLYNEKIAGEPAMVKTLIEAVKMVHPNSPPFTIVHGPPGTGKSTVTAEIVLQLMHKKPKWKILVLAPSHAATDNILASMSKWISDKSRFFRFGDQTKFTDPYVIEHHTVKSPEADLMTKSAIAAASQQKFKSDEAYEEYVNQKINKLLRKSGYETMKARQELSKKAQVHCAVLGAAQDEETNFGKKVLSGAYDVVVIDEAGFANLPETLMMLKPFKPRLLPVYS